MTFLTNTVANLEFNLMAFVENLRHMGVGMLVIFVVIGIIILATKLVNYLFSGQQCHNSPSAGPPYGPFPNLPS